MTTEMPGWMGATPESHAVAIRRKPTGLALIPYWPGRPRWGRTSCDVRWPAMPCACKGDTQSLDGIATGFARPDKRSPDCHDGGALPPEPRWDASKAIEGVHCTSPMRRFAAIAAASYAGGQGSAMSARRLRLVCRHAILYGGRLHFLRVCAHKVQKGLRNKR